jgi:hypothetical protein
MERMLQYAIETPPNMCVCKIAMRNRKQMIEECAVVLIGQALQGPARNNALAGFFFKLKSYDRC